MKSRINPTSIHPLDLMETRVTTTWELSHPKHARIKQLLAEKWPHLFCTVSYAQDTTEKVLRPLPPPPPHTQQQNPQDERNTKSLDCCVIFSFSLCLLVIRSVFVCGSCWAHIHVHADVTLFTLPFLLWPSGLFSNPSMNRRIFTESIKLDLTLGNSDREKEIFGLRASKENHWASPLDRVTVNTTAATYHKDNFAQVQAIHKHLLLVTTIGPTSRLTSACV